MSTPLLAWQKFLKRTQQKKGNPFSAGFIRFYSLEKGATSTRWKAKIGKWVAKSTGRRAGGSICQPAETWQEAQVDGLKPFEGMDIDVDVIDPIAQPRPGPDGRIEFKTHVEFKDEEASHG